jgi:hypothetical protein
MASYRMEDMQSAISAVNRHRLTVSQAAREFSLKRQTLADHVNGRYDLKTRGPERMLDQEQEATLVNYMKYMAQHGLPMSRQVTRSFIVQMINKSEKQSEILFNLETGPSDKWFRGLFKRHPDLTERAPERQEASRQRMSNENVMKQYFDLLESTMDDLGLKDKPDQVFNCDETGFGGKDKPRQKVIAERGHHAYQRQVTTTDRVTAHLCICANGTILPTFIIFENSLPHTKYADGVPGTWLFGHSESSYMDTELFKLWFEKIFLIHCGRARPVLLILDNHDSHINVDIIDMARANDVHLLGLPPHTTHILQPLDVSINGPLKSKFFTLASNLGFVNRNMVIGKAKLPLVLSYAIDQFCSPAHINGSFRKSGIVPFCPDAIDKTQLVPSAVVAAEPVPVAAAEPVPVAVAEPVQVAAAESVAVAAAEPVPGAAAEPVSGAAAEPVAVAVEEPVAVAAAETVVASDVCYACGRGWQETNPLVLSGLVPAPLAGVFRPVPDAVKTKNRRVVTKARVITGDEVYNNLKQKIATDEQTRKDIDQRKVDRQEKKKKNDEEKEMKRQERERKRKDAIEKKLNKTAKRRKTTASEPPEVMGDPEDDQSEPPEVIGDPEDDQSEPPEVIGDPLAEDDPEPNAVCEVCMMRGHPSTFWVGCDYCDRWYHYACLPLTEQFKVTASLIPRSNSKWCCNICVCEE